jgi:hypothetical protein
MSRIEAQGQSASTHHQSLYLIASPLIFDVFLGEHGNDVARVCCEYFLD